MGGIPQNAWAQEEKKEADKEEAEKEGKAAEKDAAQNEEGESDFRILPSVGTWFTGRVGTRFYVRKGRFFQIAQDP